MPVKELPEASGVAVSRKSPGVLWSHNDSGEPVIVAVGTDGTTRGRVKIAGATVGDWEDIDVGPCPGGTCVYTFYDASELGAGKVREAFRSDISGIGEAQGEGVAFAGDGTLWLASEGDGKSRPGMLAKLTCTLK